MLEQPNGHDNARNPDEEMKWMKEFEIDREAAQCAVRGQMIMADVPEEFENIFAFFVRRLRQEKDEAKKQNYEHRWYCAKGERPMLDTMDQLMQLDDDRRHTEIFQYVSQWRNTVEEKEKNPSCWSLDKRWALVPVLDMPEPSKVIEAKYGSANWRFLYAARKEGATAMRAFLYSGDIRREDVNYIRDHRGRSTLHFAATTGNADMIPFFRDLINSFDRDGYTPLHTAVWFGQKDFVEALIKANADALLAARDNSRMQPMEMARHYQWSHTERLIRDLISCHSQKAPASSLQ
eukprot:GEMP01020932.1.p2 GENE.GEMP01020932.1~~GEMP01020932.1.p2  ORF type:complete len:292 (+),score=88.29 GEMP01020932.1:141-1016(+)